VTKHRALVSVLVLMVAYAAAGFSAYAKDKNNDAGRMLTGKVTDHQDQPLPNAVVYLSNPRTRAVKSFIVGPDGVYRFPALSPSIDYEVYAQYNGRNSDTKTVSQFDTRQNVTINLRIDSK
jgi:Carboxypeptidase regulatory-like domain